MQYMLFYCHFHKINTQKILNFRLLLIFNKDNQNLWPKFGHKKLTIYCFIPDKMNCGH